MSYPELSRINRLEDVLDSKGRLVILFLTLSASEGHWICVFVRGPRSLEVFDSYGMAPDTERSWLSHSKLVQLREVEPTLLNLLRDAHARGWNIDYNKYHLQSHNTGVQTCGRHVVTRLLHQHMSNEDYNALIRGSGISPDKYVYNITASLLGK